MPKNEAYGGLGRAGTDLSSSGAIEQIEPNPALTPQLTFNNVAYNLVIDSSGTDLPVYSANGSPAQFGFNTGDIACLPGSTVGIYSEKGKSDLKEKLQKTYSELKRRFGGNGGNMPLIPEISRDVSLNTEYGGLDKKADSILEEDDVGGIFDFLLNKQSDDPLQRLDETLKLKSAIDDKIKYAENNYSLTQKEREELKGFERYVNGYLNEWFLDNFEKNGLFDICLYGDSRPMYKELEHLCYLFSDELDEMQQTLGKKVSEPYNVVYTVNPEGAESSGDSPQHSYNPVSNTLRSTRQMFRDNTAEGHIGGGTVTKKDSYFWYIVAAALGALAVTGAAVSGLKFPTVNQYSNGDSGSKKPDENVRITPAPTATATPVPTPTYTPTFTGGLALKYDFKLDMNMPFINGSPEYVAEVTKELQLLRKYDPVAFWMIVYKELREGKERSGPITNCKDGNGIQINNCLVSSIYQAPALSAVHESYHDLSEIEDVYDDELHAVAYELSVVKTLSNAGVPNEYNKYGVWNDSYTRYIFIGRMKYYEKDKPEGFNISKYYDENIDKIYPNVDGLSETLGINVQQAVDHNWSFRQVIEAKSLGINVDKIAEKNLNLSQAIAEARSRTPSTASTNSAMTLNGGANSETDAAVNS